MRWRLYYDALLLLRRELSASLPRLLFSTEILEALKRSSHLSLRMTIRALLPLPPLMSKTSLGGATGCTGCGLVISSW
jgi:hypothetical protein